MITERVLVTIEVKGAGESKRAADDVNKALKLIFVEAEQTKGALSRAFGAVGDLSKALAPMNQAFELGGKALRALDSALDAYAKTGSVAARDVKRLEKSFTDLSNSIKAAAGAAVSFTLQALPSVSEIAAVADRMDKGSSLKDAFKAEEATKKLKEEKNAVDVLIGSFEDLTRGLPSLETAVDNFNRGVAKGSKAMLGHGVAMMQAKLDLQELNAAFRAGGIPLHEYQTKYEALMTTLNGGELPAQIKLWHTIADGAREYHRELDALIKMNSSGKLSDEQFRRGLSSVVALNPVDVAGQINAEVAARDKLLAIKKREKDLFDDPAGLAQQADRESEVLRVLNEIQTPMEVYREQISDLQKMYDEGGLSAKQFSEAIKKVRESASGVLDASQNRDRTLLGLVFGPIDDMSQYKEMLDSLGISADTFFLELQGAREAGRLFSAFNDAVGASYETIVTGQGSVSAAFKKVFADSIMAMGKDSAVAALKETALGFGALALGPIGGVSAATHFKSAALHAGVAVAAGVAAHSLGTSAQVEASAKAEEERKKEEEKQQKEKDKGRGRGGSSGSGDGAGHDTTIIVYADPFAEGSPGTRRRNAKKVMDRAKGGGDWEDS